MLQYKFGLNGRQALKESNKRRDDADKLVMLTGTSGECNDEESNKVIHDKKVFKRKD